MTTEPTCAGCRACCRNQAVVVMPEDESNRSIYVTHLVKVRDDMLTMLQNKPNGDCAHLGTNGCTIYPRRPIMCVAYDCRKQFSMTPKRERRALGTPEVWAAARKRLDTLDQDDHAMIRRMRR